MGHPPTEMASVACFGSVNVDRVRFVDDATLADLAATYPWFPSAGETVTVESVPAEFIDAADEVFLGGKGANQAAAAAAAGADAFLAGAVGRDHDRAGVLPSLRERGVDVRDVAVTGERTGTALVFVAPDGENHIAVVPGANGDLDADDAGRALPRVRAADCLLLQNEVPVDAMRALLDGLADAPDAPMVLYDPAPADGAGALLAHPAVDVVTPNAAEAETVAASLADFDGLVVRTRGADGVVVEGPDGFSQSAPPVDPVDTTAAGDVFTGYLAARLGEAAPLRDAVEEATAAASLSTTVAGAQASIPDRSVVTDLLASR
ncbi:MAG: PfkB family carbohydrate kinase [Halorientalis sp.]